MTLCVLCICGRSMHPLKSLSYAWCKIVSDRKIARKSRDRQILNRLLGEEGRKGGNHRNLSEWQEKELLEGFRQEAEKGRVITPREIKVAYDKLTGKETKDTFIYTVLRRNKWRVVMPRSKHPKKASDEEIESSKKNMPSGAGCFWRVTVQNCPADVSRWSRVRQNQ